MNCGTGQRPARSCCAAAWSSTAPERRATRPTCGCATAASPRSAANLARAGEREIDVTRTRRLPGLHRRPYARRSDRARLARDAAEDQPGRDDRRRRQLRHQPRSAGARQRAASAQSARRPRQARVPDHARVRARPSTTARPAVNVAALVGHSTLARRDDGRPLSAGHRGRAGADGRARSREAMEAGATGFSTGRVLRDRCRCRRRRSRA